MNRIHLRAHERTRRLQIVAVLVTLIASAAISATASASTGQSALILDPVAQSANPAAALSEYRELGATTVRVLLKWYTVAPKANSRTAPRGFKAANPAAYSQKLFSQYDMLISDAIGQGFKVDLDIMGGPPAWAQGKGAPAKFLHKNYGWEPNAADYGQFVTAVAKRYNGTFKVDGTTLPKVSIFSLWNEPNFGEQLGPQQIRTGKAPAVLVSPMYYRNLLRSGYRSLKRSARRATILFGETAAAGKLGPRSSTSSDQISISSPMAFLQSLYCVDGSYKRLTGAAAKAVGCTNLGSFKKQNPALFSSSAYAAHPYGSQFAPNATKVPAGQFILPVIGRLTTTLDKLNRAWRSSKKFPIWSTEYGFVTDPPFKPKGGRRYPNQTTAATYLNEAEYLSYKNPRLATYAQYLVNDPPDLTKENVGLFASGLASSTGVPKPGFDAYRLPLWLPKQSVSRNARTEIWGGARPATFGFAQDRTAQTVAIQEQKGASAPWTTLATETVKSTNGYFDTHMKLAASGNLRLAYTYPADEPFLPIGIAGTTVFSRTVKVTVH